MITALPVNHMVGLHSTVSDCMFLTYQQFHALDHKKVHGIHLCGKAGRHAARRTVRTHGSGRKKAPALPAGNILEKSLFTFFLA
ncbi:hypothetical protein [Akkermansia sp.]|uniref:hypothetical protein n=1 Tax=Akkermansia sp. TaxID=1872421 RepID=UPI0025BBB4F7|nr:hypothetical protein [Akkermansia sp.]MCD8064661.1 hypothetical protein [Akkermansia sp.]